MSMRGMQVLPNDPGCVDPRRPQFDEAAIDRKSYINVGDLVDCISDVTFKDEETADIIATTLEWIIGKRSIDNEQFITEVKKYFPLSMDILVERDQMNAIAKYINFPIPETNGRYYNVEFICKPTKVEPTDIT